MLDRLRFILQHNCHINATNPLVVGVSGGPDSLCLVDMLVRLDYHVVVAHFNHLLRPEAFEEAGRVEDLARQLGASFVSDSQDVAQFALSRGLSIEEAARVLRYRFLFAQAQRFQAQAVVVGHTADDQVETVLMHLLRGAGMDGLKGMAYWSLPNPWSAEIPLVRPLLAFWREEILAYLTGHGLQASIDASNLEVKYFRNRLRHEVIPILEQIQPQLRRLLWRTADVLHEEHLALEAVLQVAWEGCAMEQGRGYLALNTLAFSAQPLAVQRRLLRRAIALLQPGLRDVSFETIERGLTFIGSQPCRGTCSLVAGLFLFEEGERIWLSTWEAELPTASWPQMPPQEVLEFSPPGEVSLAGGWVLQAMQAVDAGRFRGEILSNTDPFQAWFDAEALPLPLIVRRRRPGDRIEPLGMQGRTLKISDLMVNIKIPRRLRHGWPLVCTKQDILWVPGCRQSQLVRVTAATRWAVRLVLAESCYNGDADH